MQIIFSLIHLARRQRPEKQNSVETNRIHRVVTNNKLGFVNAEIKNDINGRGKKRKKKMRRNEHSEIEKNRLSYSQK